MVLAWLTIVTEIVSSLCVTLGALVPIVSVPMVIVLLVAIFTVHLPNGFCSTKLQTITSTSAHFGQLSERPETWVTERTGHMGYTFRFRAGGVDAVESEFGHGRTPSLCRRILDGEEAMTDVCRDFGISRKTGYKIFDRYKEHGLAALSDRSRRPIRYANQLPQQTENLIVRLKSEKHWGARKIRELLVRRLDADIRVPAKSTIHAVLDRHSLVKHGGGPRHRARGTPLSQGAAPNDLWCDGCPFSAG